MRLISARACARSRLVSATTAFRRSISRRVSETREREETGLSSTDSAHCTATRCASPRLPNAQGLIQGSTADGTSDRNRSSMGTTGHLSLYRSLNACRMFSLRVVPNLVQLARRELQAGCGLRADHSVSNPDFGAVVSPVDEGVKLVDREEVLDAITELLGHVLGVVGERLGRVARLPTPVLDLEGLQQVAVVERGERLDGDRPQIVHQSSPARGRTLVDCADAWLLNVAMGRPTAAEPASLTTPRLVVSCSSARCIGLSKGAGDATVAPLPRVGFVVDVFLAMGGALGLAVPGADRISRSLRVGMTWA